MRFVKLDESCGEYALFAVKGAAPEFRFCKRLVGAMVSANNQDFIRTEDFERELTIFVMTSPSVNLRLVPEKARIAVAVLPRSFFLAPAPPALERR